MPKRKKYSDIKHASTVHTKVSFYTILLAIVVQFFLFVRHYDVLFGQLCGIEAFFALIGLIVVDFMRDGKVTFFHRNLQKPSKDLFFRVIVILSVVLFIQLFFQLIPLTVRDWEFALAIVFAAPCEEIFFRALMIEPFTKFSKKDDMIRITSKRSISYLEIFGILISSVFFAMFHVNYYGNVRIMLSVLGGGIWLGFMYCYYRDLTAVILAHFLLNIIVVFQSFYLIGGLT